MAYWDYVNKDLYEHNIEFKAISHGIQPEFDRQYLQIDFNFSQRWIKSASEEGVRELEAIYEILPDAVRDSLEVRKERLLEIKRRREPFTERWMHSELYMRAGASLKAEINNLILTLTFYRPLNMPSPTFFELREIREVMPWFRHILPANILMEFIYALEDMNFHNYLFWQFILLEDMYYEYDLWNITAPWPPWKGEIDFDGQYIWTPRHHGIEFPEKSFEIYDFDNFEKRPILWNGQISFNGNNYWGDENYSRNHINIIIEDVP